MSDYTKTINGVVFEARINPESNIELRASRTSGDAVELEFYEAEAGEVRSALVDHFRGVKVDRIIHDWANDTLRVKTLDDGKLEVTLDDRQDEHRVALTRLEVKALATTVGVTNDELSAPRITASKPLAEVADARAAWNATAVDTAAKLGLGIAFRYAKGNDGSNIESRRITGELSAVPAGAYTLVTGYDPDREDWRAFRLDRIKGFVQVIE